MAGVIKGNTTEVMMRIHDLINMLEIADVSTLQEAKTALQLLRNSCAKAINKVDTRADIPKSTQQENIHHVHKTKTP